MTTRAHTRRDDAQPPGVASNGGYVLYIKPRVKNLQFHRCTRCGEYFPLSCFHSDSSRARGHANQCKWCSTAKASAYHKTEAGHAVWKAAKKRYAKSAKGRACKNRQRQKPEQRARLAEKQRRRLEEDPEYRARRRASLRKSKAKRRALKRGARVGRVDKKAIWERQNGNCYLCGETVPFDSTCHLEHETPLSRGGSHDMRNCRVSCAPCNIQKGAYTALEFWMRAG